MPDHNRNGENFAVGPRSLSLLDRFPVVLSERPGAFARRGWPYGALAAMAAAKAGEALADGQSEIQREHESVRVGVESLGQGRECTLQVVPV